MKHGFTLEQHKAIAKELCATKDLLMAILVSVSQAYPLTVSSRINKAVDNIDRARSKLDDCLFQESHRREEPDDPKLGYIYYPGQEGQTRKLGGYFERRKIAHE